MENSNISGNRLMLVLLFLVSLVSVVAVIVAAVSLTNSGSDTPSINVNSQPAAGASSSGGSGSPIIINSGSGGSGSSNSGSGNRIFKIGYSLQSTANMYLDDQGYMKGFGMDLINGVCAIGGMNCVTIWDVSTNFWTRDGYGGQGLFNGWYDACFNLRPTIERVQVFDFSLSFHKPEFFHLYTLKTTSNFNGNDISGKKIGFVDGWAASATCLARHTEIKGSDADNTHHYANPQACVDALVAGEVDALFGGAHYFTASMDKMKQVQSPPIACALDGNAIMTAKDNDFNSYWNRAFQKFKDSGKFRKLCEQAQLDHGHIGDLRTCVDAP